MLVWLVRQVLYLRKALLNRKHPRRLAWGLALGLVVGLVPKGNLVAVGLIGFALLLQINHSMLAVAAVAASFAAIALDPWTHRIGLLLLEHPQTGGAIAWLYRRPLGAWTDLNNTVVLGSLTLGLAAVFPTYTLSVPLFRRLAGRFPESEPPDPTPASGAVVLEPHGAEAREAPRVVAEPDLERVAVETRIDVIRLRHSPEEAASGEPGTAEAAEETPGQASEEPSDEGLGTTEVNEALRYLVRHVRSAREGKAA